MGKLAIFKRIRLSHLASVGVIWSGLALIVSGSIVAGAALVLFSSIAVQALAAEHSLRKLSAQFEDVLGVPCDFNRSGGADDALLSAQGFRRRSNALVPELIEGTLSGPGALSRALNRIVETGMRQLAAESCELAIFDKEHGKFHSSIVLGLQFRVSIDEHLTGGAEREERPMHLEPISFAGTVLGAIRIALPLGRPVSEEVKTIIRLLALQASVAIVNADFLSELLKMREHSEASQKARAGFLANLSHELRGPLGIVLNGAELVLEGICGPVTADQKETLGMILKNGAHVLELVNDVLDFARVESGKVSAQPVSLSTRDLLLDIASVVRSQADAKRHKIIVEDKNDYSILVDRRHIRQMLINLLTNAIKYTPDGGEIKISAGRTRAGRVRISVKDTGVGIPPEDRARVFNAFERLDHAYSKKQIGTGLGLSLTRKLAEVNHGIVDFDSTPGQGSVFWLQFPAGEGAVPDVDEPVQAKLSGGGKQVLIISAAQEESGILQRYLQEHEFAVDIASSIQDALRCIGATRYALAVIYDSALLDFEQSPIPALRDELFGVSTPVVLLSGGAFNFNIEEALRSGVDRHIPKPVALSEILRILVDVMASEARLSIRSSRKGGPDPIMH